MGSTIIHEDVFREIVRLLLEEVEEVYVYEPKGPLAPFLGEKAIKPIINIYQKKLEPIQDDPTLDDVANEAETQKQPEIVEIEVKLALIYGASIPQTVAKIREEISERIKRYTGYNTERVDIYITRIIRFEDERSEQENESETTSDHPDEGSGQSGIEG